MRKQPIIYRFGFVALGFATFVVSPSLLTGFRFNPATATIDANKGGNLIARRNRLRLTAAKPGGEINNVNGEILIPEKFAVNPDASDPNPLIARFTQEIMFQVKAWDPKKGNRDGDGIEKMEISFTKDNQQEPIYNHTEKFSPYCFFEGASPCGSLKKFWPNGQLIENGQYSANIQIYLKNSSQPAQWFFRFEIQRPN
ncbi:hypothetical protein [Scytonema sp. NUACC26]|uniref:hypothetical protein n=1 Tax=Scytonema sp. NUACC26 TaxID=3140176 RepID=UPI0034DB9C72